MTDRNFNGLAKRFARNIYGTRKGRIRLAVLARDLAGIVNSAPLTILDAGGGQGQFSCQLASHGHQITLCDISEEMLALALQHKTAAGVGDESLRLLHCPIQQIDEAAPGPYQLVMCHAVLEWVAEQAQLVQTLAAQIAAGGYLSLMFYNIDGQRFHHLHHGNFAFVAKDMPAKGTLQPDHPVSLDDVEQWLAGAGLNIVSRSGVRVINDYLQQKTIDPEQEQQLMDAELKWSTHPAYLRLGRYIHILARKS